MQAACSCTMSVLTFQVVCPSDADIDRAKQELNPHVPPDMMPYILLMQSIPDAYREAFFTAAHHLQAVESDLRLKWMSSASAWKDSRCDYSSGQDSRTISDAQRTSLGSRDTYQSSTSAASAPPSPFPFPNDGARESGGAQGFHDRALQASGAIDIFSPSWPTFDGVPNTALNGPHSTTPAGQHFEPSGSLVVHANHPNSVVEQHVTPPDVSTVDTEETISQIPQAGGKEKSASNSKARWLCPVCGTGCTRAGDMKQHIWNLCLNPIQYLCVGCRFRSHRFDVVQKHCQSSIRCGPHGPQMIEVPARIKYASCLTGRLFNTAEELIENADRHCRRSQVIQKSDQNSRLLALLGYGELNREIERQCMSNVSFPKLWECCEWESEDAKQFSNIAEFGLQGARYLRTSEAPNNAIPIAGVGLEQYNLGIVDMREFASRVLRKSNMRSFFEPERSFTDLYDFSAARSTASVPTEINPVNYDLGAQPTVHPQNESLLPPRALTGARMLDQGQAHMQANPAHDQPFGSPQSVNMLDFDSPLAQSAQYDDEAMTALH